MSLLSNLQISTNGEAALGAISESGAFIQFDGVFDGATVSLMSSTDGGTTFNKIRDFTSPDRLRYDGSVGEVLKLTTAAATANTNIQVSIR
jgi:hypothetical protein